eukprot:13711137-Heterocapsa_arctica.AAC.1
MGYIPGRRREDALLVIRAAQWHLSASRLGFVTSYWDVTNAFGVSTHDAMDATVDRLDMKHDASFPEMIVLAPREGDRQGDGPAAQKFALTYD